MDWTSERLRELEQFGTDVSRPVPRLAVARESLEHGYPPESLNDVNAEIEAVEEVGKQRAEAEAWKLKLLMDQRPFLWLRRVRLYPPLRGRIEIVFPVSLDPELARILHDDLETLQIEIGAPVTRPAMVSPRTRVLIIVPVGAKQIIILAEELRLDRLIAQIKRLYFQT